MYCFILLAKLLTNTRCGANQLTTNYLTEKTTKYSTTISKTFVFLFLLFLPVLSFLKLLLPIILQNIFHI